MTHGYPNLHRDWGWTLGVHKAPPGYQHPWLVVTPNYSAGAWTRAEARADWRYAKRIAIAARMPIERAARESAAHVIQH